MWPVQNATQKLLKIIKLLYSKLLCIMRSGKKRIQSISPFLLTSVILPCPWWPQVLETTSPSSVSQVFTGWPGFLETSLPSSDLQALETSCYCQPLVCFPATCFLLCFAHSPFFLTSNTIITSFTIEFPLLNWYKLCIFLAGFWLNGVVYVFI